MKAIRFIPVVIACVFCAITMMAQDVIPIDSVNLHSKEQKETLKYAKLFGKRRKNKILLPVEVNHLLNDSLNNKRATAVMQIDKSYFVNGDAYKAALVIPTLAKVNGLDVFSEINIVCDHDGNYITIVYTTFDIPQDEAGEKICLKSNVNGILVSSVIYNDKGIVAEVDAKGEPWGLVVYKKKAGSDKKYNRGIYNAFHTAEGWKLSLYESKLRYDEIVNSAVGIKINK